MNSWYEQIKHLLTIANIVRFSGVILLFVLGVVAAKLVSRYLSRVMSRNFDSHQTMVARKLSYNIIIVLTIVSCMHQMGINLSVILGATGLLTVAIGFAAQTSFANVISGVFMILEKPFKINDVVRIGNTQGEVLSIGWFSTHLRTGDNQMVRIPNESLMKSEISNLTRFPTRRFDLPVGISYDTDIDKAREVLVAAAKTHPFVLQEPEPKITFVSFADSSVNVVLNVWVARDRHGDMGVGLADIVKKALAKANIEIPYPHQVQLNK